MSNNHVLYALILLSISSQMENSIKRYSSTATIYKEMQQGQKRLSIYENVPANYLPGKNEIEDQSNDAEVDFFRRMAVKRKFMDHYRNDHCKNENSFLRFNYF